MAFSFIKGNEDVGKFLTCMCIKKWQIEKQENGFESYLSAVWWNMDII